MATVNPLAEMAKLQAEQAAFQVEMLGMTQKGTRDEVVFQAGLKLADSAKNNANQVGDILRSRPA